jgi:hypothetical protein
LFLGRLIEFFLDWIFDGRLPREELHVRPWIAVSGVLVIGTLAIALIVTALD